MTQDNRQYYLYAESPIARRWYESHRVVFMHRNQTIHITSLTARLRWRVPFWSAK